MKTQPGPATVNPNWKMTLEELVAGSEGKVRAQFQREFTGVGTDTRADLKGQIFVALKGDNFDAHDFLPQAVAAGATALLVHRIPENAQELLNQVTVIQVGDTLKGLQLLGNFWRHKMKAKILGVTGTNGKTTTKEFTASVLEAKFKTQYSKGSFNNHWGVPISLLSIDKSHQAAVIEMGMNHPGELTTLSQIAEPDAVLVTMVGRGHLEGVGSIEGAAKAKAEIYEHAPAHAIRIFNLENEYTQKMYESWGRALPESQVIRFAGETWVKNHAVGAASGAAPDIVFGVKAATPDSLTIHGSIRGVQNEVIVPVFGRHNVTNLMAAASFALACGMTPSEIWNALPRCRMAWGRNQWVHLECGARVLFDAYNANPESMSAAVENFAQLSTDPGRKFAILGEMRELGEHAPDLHRELGEKVARAGFDGVYFFGPSQSAFKAGVEAAGFDKSLLISNSYENNLAPSMLPVLNPNDIVLIKGSRGMQLEKALRDLKPIDF